MDKAHTPAAPAVVLQIPIDKIVPSPHQARKDFDEAALKGLAESMKQTGLLGSILVRKVGARYELISGERRVRAAKLLGWPTIEAKVIDTASDADAAAKGMVENLQRVDLNPMEEAEGFQTLSQLDPKYWTQRRMGQTAGKSESYIARSLDLLDLPEPIKENLRARKFSRSHGLEIARLSNVAQQLEVARQISGRLTWEETRALVDKMLGKSSTDPARKAGQIGGGHKVSQYLKEEGYKFVREGDSIIMSARLPWGPALDLDSEMAKLRASLMLWISQQQQNGNAGGGTREPGVGKRLLLNKDLPSPASRIPPPASGSNEEEEEMRRAGITHAPSWPAGKFEANPPDDDTVTEEEIQAILAKGRIG